MATVVLGEKHYLENFCPHRNIVWNFILQLISSEHVTSGNFKKSEKNICTKLKCQWIHNHSDFALNNSTSNIIVLFIYRIRAAIAAAHGTQVSLHKYCLHAC